MGPVMNYVDEIKTEEIELRISKFEEDGKTTFVVPVNEEMVLIEYTASNGKHTVNIDKTNITFKIEAFNLNAIHQLEMESTTQYFLAIGIADIVMIIALAFTTQQIDVKIDKSKK